MGAVTDLISLDGGPFLMGSEDPDAHPADGEGPVREVVVAPFEIAAKAVSVEQYAAFAAATGHVTEAERQGWSFVFAGLLPDGFPATRANAMAPWWRAVEGASWRAPEGPGSTAPATILSCTPPGTTPPRTARGRAAGCRRRRSGSWRRAAGSSRSAFPG